MLFMKRLALLLPALALASPAQAACVGHPGTAQINLEISNVRSSKGRIALTLYADDASKFLRKRGSLYVPRVDAVGPVTRACIFVPKPGYYALAVYHDENANKKMDRTGIGLPAEGFGFTNNPKLFLSMPTFKSARLKVPADGVLARIRLRYP